MEVCPEGFRIVWGAYQNGWKRWTQMAGQMGCVKPDLKLSSHPQAVQMLEPSPLGLSDIQIVLWVSLKANLTGWTEVSHFTLLYSSFYAIFYV